MSTSKWGILFVSAVLLGFFLFRKAVAQPSIQIEPAAASEVDVDTLLQQMTPEEKIGQMTLVQKDALKPEDVQKRFIGAVLSGGGGNPQPNNPPMWRDMVDQFQEATQKTRLKIPLLYGVDAVHGHGNVAGATIFPQNIGLGAADDPALLRQIGKATAREMNATDVNWNYAPVLSVPLDLRWGRVYETFGDDLERVTRLGVAYQQGLQTEHVLATPKHFVGEGLEEYGTSKEYKLDQGEIQISTSEREKYLEPFHEAIKNGAMSLMISRSSLNGKKLSANKELLTNTLKEAFGFQGFLVSDWGAIDQLSNDPYQNIVTSINAGIDMVMVPDAYDAFITNVTKAVQTHDISQERIDDAVRRILRAKQSIGLFKAEKQDIPIEEVGTDAHRLLAREAVQKSLVLLKNKNGALPLKAENSLLVVGKGADDIGFQSGGWTIDWQGRRGNDLLGTSILKALGEWALGGNIIDASKQQNTLTEKTDTALVVVGEEPYAEGVGDRADLTLSKEDQQNIAYAHKNAKQVIVLVIAGRPLIMTQQIEQADAVVMAWLPGGEGVGIVDVLTGSVPFQGRLPLGWPRTMQQVKARSSGNLLFPSGYGLALEKSNP